MRLWKREIKLSRNHKMKTVLLVPGFQESMQTRDYRAVMDVITDQGYDVRFVPIHWKRTTIIDWVNELDEVYRKYDPAEVILAGFSYGAMTVFAAAAARTPFQLWCFSLSPYFSEDVESVRMKLGWLRAIGIRRTAAFSQLRFKDLVNKLSCRTLLFVGGSEAPIVQARSLAAHQFLANNHLTTIPNVGHDVGSPLYVAAIKKGISHGN